MLFQKLLELIVDGIVQCILASMAVFFVFGDDNNDQLGLIHGDNDKITC